MGPHLISKDAKTWTNMPAALTEFCGGTGDRWVQDGSQLMGGLAMQCEILTPAPAGGRLELQVSDVGAEQWEDAISDNEPYLLIDSAGWQFKAGMGLTSAATSGVKLWRLVGRNGDGSADPVIANVRIDLT